MPRPACPRPSSLLTLLQRSAPISVCSCHLSSFLFGAFCQPSHQPVSLLVPAQGGVSASPLRGASDLVPLPIPLTTFATSRMALTVGFLPRQQPVSRSDRVPHGQRAGGPRSLLGSLGAVCGTQRGLSKCWLNG